MANYWGDTAHLCPDKEEMMELWNFETSGWDSLDRAMKRSEMEEAGDNFIEAVESLKKAQKKWYWSAYWLDYGEECKN